MAVTTEPPWLNKTSGISPRNATSTHTISFGWTAGTGTFLVVVMAGSVTNANAGGWTERLQPVNNTELSVFTKTGAGESSITVTNNAANYPVAWVAYEFRAGTTWTNGIGSTTSADVFPTLTGLPGTAQMVIAARSRSASATNSTGSTEWPAGWVEDLDAATPRNVTDGVFLSVGHQLNVTATSITPTSTPTYENGFTASRQHVAFALDVAAPSALPTQTWTSLHYGATTITSLNLGSTLLWQA